MNHFKMQYANYSIKKKDFLKFVELINETDSFKFINYNKAWIENFNEKKVKEQSSTPSLGYCLLQDQIASIMIGRRDSVPIFISLTSNKTNNNVALC